MSIFIIDVIIIIIIKYLHSILELAKHMNTLCYVRELSGLALFSSCHAGGDLAGGGEAGIY